MTHSLPTVIRCFCAVGKRKNVDRTMCAAAKTGQAGERHGTAGEGASFWAGRT